MTRAHFVTFYDKQEADLMTSPVAAWNPELALVMTAGVAALAGIAPRYFRFISRTFDDGSGPEVARSRLYKIRGEK